MNKILSIRLSFILDHALKSLSPLFAQRRGHKLTHSMLLLLLCEFFTPTLTDGFHWSLGDTKSPKVSRTILSILIDLKNTLA